MKTTKTRHFRILIWIFSIKTKSNNKNKNSTTLIGQVYLGSFILSVTIVVYHTKHYCVPSKF